MSKLNMSNIFKRAHAFTRRTVRAGDSYSATFVFCLKICINNDKQAAMMQGNYKKIGTEWGAFIDGDYDRRTKSVSRPAVGDKVCITTKSDECHTRTVAAIVTNYSSGTIVILVDDAAVARKAQERYNAKIKINSNISRAQNYDNIMNEGYSDSGNLNPYRQYA